MIDINRFESVLARYKNDFAGKTWEDERYKWEAVKHFQDNWDVNAPDFAAMLERSLSKCGNLLTSRNSFPAGMITEFAEARPEDVRSMFIELFDEREDYYGRIAAFKERAGEILYAVRGKDTDRKHYQDENTITTYLWLRYPDRYYIYKYSEAKEVAAEIAPACEIKRGQYTSNVRNHLVLYNDMRRFLRNDAELRSILDSLLTPECYPDPEMCTLTIDFGFYISRYLHDETVKPGESPASEDGPLESSDGEGTRPAGASIVDGETGYWWLTASPKIWSFSDMAVGAVQDYTLHNENGNKRRIFQNFLDAKVGDMVIGYESHPVKQVVAIARICAEQDGECIYFEKVEGLSNPIDYKTLHDCPELEGMEYFVNPQGSIFKLTPDEYGFILDIIREENPLPSDDATEPYGKDAFLADIYMDEARYDRLRALLLRKKNIILQGAPGVGKTFAARRLAWSVMGEKDDDRIEFVQFHQSYSYEDFIMGYRPEGDSFEIKYGIFYRFCQKAANRPGEPLFFIIDEINRGNMSKVFGELLMLIEPDYRGSKVALAYNGLPFSVPENLYIIGMMNTADRSLAMIDYALRRRFSFFDMDPGFDSKGFTEYREDIGSETLDRLVDKVKELNAEIARDKSLGRGFCIGHSYFCGKGADEDADEWCMQVVDFDIVPTLREYWFDDEEKVTRWENALRGVFQQ